MPATIFKTLVKIANCRIFSSPPRRLSLHALFFFSPLSRRVTASIHRTRTHVLVKEEPTITWSSLSTRERLFRRESLRSEISGVRNENRCTVSELVKARAPAESCTHDVETMLRETGLCSTLTRTRVFYARARSDTQVSSLSLSLSSPLGEEGGERAVPLSSSFFSFSLDALIPLTDWLRSRITAQFGPLFVIS